jgi:hypothetical protein
VTKEIAARIAIKLKPKITQRGHRAVRKTLKQGGTAKAKVTITAVGANGATSVGKRNVVLRLG